MLENFEIINGEISPSFDPLNNIYTVNVENSVTSIEFTYECDNCTIEIFNNDILLEGENEVIINVYKDNEMELYTFLVNRDKSEVVFFEENIIETDEIYNSKLMDSYEVEYLIIVCILLIFIVFKFIFRKRI